MLLPLMHFSKISGLLKFFVVFIQKLVLVHVHAEKSFHVILYFLLQTCINVSDNSIAMVVHNSNSITMILPAMSILSQ